MKLKVLHLSDTPLSGSPVRIAKLLNKYSENYEARHLVWTPVVQARNFETHYISSNMSKEEVMQHLEWADIIHYHNRYARQEIFVKHHLTPPKKLSVIHMHSPRESEDFSQEIESGIPIAVVAQFQPRLYSEASFVLPNVVDIFDPAYMPVETPFRSRPVVSFAPSNTNMTGWNDKGYGIVAPILKRMSLANKIQYQLIIEQPHTKAMEMKRGADIGIDDIVNGSYHMSALEYMAMGIPCICRLDDLTMDIVCNMTGCDKHNLPWISATRDTFKDVLETIIREKAWKQLGNMTRDWMQKFWNPSALLSHYECMYEELQ